MGEAKQEEAKAEPKPEDKKEEKQEEKKPEEKKEEAKPSPPPPIVLFVDLHCLGCAKKIERSILKCRGVEEVEIDMVRNQLTVKGVVDPQALCSRIQKKTTRRAKVLSAPPPTDGDTTKPEAAVVAPQVSGVATVELHVNMHCEACAQQLRRKVLKMRGVQAVETELSAKKVTVTGTMNADKLVEYVHRRTGKLARVIPPPPPPPPPPPKEEEKKEEAGKKSEEKPPEEKKEKKEEEKKEEATAPQEQGKESGGKEDKGGGEEGKKAAGSIMIGEEEMAKMAYLYGGGGAMHEEMARRMVQYVPIYVMDRPPPPPPPLLLLPPPPQLFSDENPNACCIS